jgi:hypothetical protein
MPIYRFAVRREDDHDSDVRWTHLPDKETARRFANLLIKEFVSSGRYSDSPRTCLEVKDDSGALLLSIPFPQSIAPMVSFCPPAGATPASL